MSTAKTNWCFLNSNIIEYNSSWIVPPLNSKQFNVFFPVEVNELALKTTFNGQLLDSGRYTQWCGM